jgi:transcriptional regulator with XRE-family HTH domain
VETADFLRRLGATIAAHRRGAGLTQERLAERLGTSAEWVSQIERGVGRPSVETVLRIADALGQSPSALFGVADALPADAAEDAAELLVLLGRLGPRGLRVLLATARALDAERGRGDGG